MKRILYSLFSVLILILPTFAKAENPFDCPGYENAPGKNPIWVDVVDIQAKVPGASDFSPITDTCLLLQDSSMTEDYFFITGTLMKPGTGMLDAQIYPLGTRFKINMRLTSPRENWRWGIVSAKSDLVTASRGADSTGNPNDISIEGNSIAYTSYSDPPICTKTIVEDPSFFNISALGYDKKILKDDPNYRFYTQAIYYGRAYTAGVLVDLEGETIKTSSTICQQPGDLSDGLLNVYIPLGYYTALNIPFYPAVLSKMSDELIPLMFKVSSIGKGLILRSFTVRRTFGELTSSDGQATSSQPEGLLFSLGIDQDVSAATTAKLSIKPFASTGRIGLSASAKAALKQCVLKKKLKKGKKFKRKGSNISCK